MTVDKHLLGEFAHCQTGPFGSQLHEEDYVEIGTPIVTVEHLGEVGFSHQNLPFVSDDDKARLKKYILEEGDIVFSRVGSVDRCTYVTKEEDGWMFSGRCIRVRCNSSISSRYLSFYFRLEEFKKMMRSISVGATMASLNTSLMNNLVLYLPDLTTQLKTASLLDAIDSKIKLNNCINSELESMAKTLYDYWFVQFDFPDANGKPYKTAGGKMVYNPILKREIPERWEVSDLGEYISFNRGISYKSADIQDTGIPFINLNSFTLSGEFKYKGTKYFNGKYKDENLLSPGDLVIAITDVTRNADIIGKSFVIPDVFESKSLMSCDVASVSSTIIGKFYLEQLFNSKHYHKYIKHFASGTLVLHLDLHGVKWFKAVLPPSNLLSKYETTCQTLLAQRDTVIKENLILNRLRDWLLPMLMNGQVTVK